MKNEFKNKGDVQSCCECRGLKFFGHNMKLWERVVGARLSMYGFMSGKRTTDTMFASGMLMEKRRQGQKELHCAFVDLEKNMTGCHVKMCGIV